MEGAVALNTMNNIADSNDVLWMSEGDLYLEHVFEDTTLVYCKLSGDTHFLSFLPADILKLIEKKPMSISALHTHFLTEYDFSENDLPLSIMKDAITQLDETGLAWPSAADAK